MTDELKMMHLRVPVELHQRVAEYARRTRRSMSAAAIVLIEQALDAEEGEQ